MWGSGASDVYVGGTSEFSAGTCRGDAVLQHWDGAAFSAVAGVTSKVKQISGSGPSDVWVVGDALPLHFNGTKWAAVPTASLTEVTAIWASSPTDAWSIEGYQSKLRHWDGASGLPMLETGAGLLNLAGAGGDVWAVGGGGAILYYAAR